MLKCELCNREFNSLKSLGLHLSHSHKGYSHKKYYDLYMKKDGDGICPVCGKITKFKGGLHGYNRTCSFSCGQKHPETRAKLAKTNLERYGATNPYGSKEIRDKIKKKNLKNLGVENPFQQKEVQLKARHNSHTKKAEAKRQQTCLEKYGNKYHIASEEIKKKTLNTLKERYNVTNSYSIPEIHAKAVQNSLGYHDDNGNESSWEAILEDALINKNIKFNKHYNKDPRYPYFCDFYLIDTDTFIEINGFWMHGGHYFNKSNKADLEKLKVWKSKKSQKLYETAINVWTKSDLIKRKTAKKNKLNYIVLWTLKDIDNYINSL